MYCFFDTGQAANSGGGNIGSTAILLIQLIGNKKKNLNLKVFSSTKGINLASNGEDISKHGLVLASIR